MRKMTPNWCHCQFPQKVPSAGAGGGVIFPVEVSEICTRSVAVSSSKHRELRGQKAERGQQLYFTVEQEMQNS